MRIIDRRENPKGKNLPNRQHFMRRTGRYIQDLVKESVRKRNIKDIGKEEKVSISSESIREPSFHHARGSGRRKAIFPGNKEFSRGDRIRKPQGGGEGGGKSGADDGEGHDEFAFTLSREEFLNFLFEDLELPDLVKKSLKEMTALKPRRAGFRRDGTPATLDIGRTAQMALGRRIALRRPKNEDIEELERKIATFGKLDCLSSEEENELEALTRLLAYVKERQKVVPWLDPVDTRYRNYEEYREPNTNAVMFCIMDVSGSMGEREKDLAKRFFLLLYLFLEQCYERIDIVFIRHTHTAREVDEDTFFHETETGGTVVSTAFIEMKKIIDERYPPSEWNIYAAQASDGDNYSGDTATCVLLLGKEILPLCQYCSYVEIIEEKERDLMRDETIGNELWMAYRTLAVDERYAAHFAMKRVGKSSDIFPVFLELFEKKDAA